MSDEKEHKSGKGETKIGAVIVLIISAIVFIPAGGAAVFQAFFNKNDIPTFGSYNGKKIEYVQGSDFVTNVSNIAQQYQYQGYDVNQQSYNIYKQAFDTTVLNMAIDEAIEESGWTVPQSYINRSLVRTFSDKDGKFDQKLYNQTDSQTVKEMRDDITKQAKFERYVVDVFGQSEAFNGKTLYGTKSSSKENNFIASMGSEKHAFSLAAFNTSDFPREEALKYAQENSDLFVKYDLSAISVNDKDEAATILKRIKADEIKFEDAVADKSSNYYTDSDGKLTGSYRYQISNILKNSQDVDSIISLGLDEISEVIETATGYTIFRCNGLKTEADFTSSDMMDTVVSYLNSYEKSYIEDYYTDIASSFRANAAINTFEDACQSFNIAAVDVAPFPLNYADSAFYDKIPSAVTQLSGLSTSENALTKMFSLKIDEISEPIVLGSNVLVIKCTDIINDGNASTDSYSSSIAYIDSSCAQQAILNSDKVENNFLQTYFTYFVNNK